MSVWQEVPTGYIREKADGTIERHPHKYIAHEQFTFRATYDPATGRCVSVEPYAQKAHALIEIATGEIKAVNVGFNLHAELNGTHPFGDVPAGHEVVELEASSHCPDCGRARNHPHEEIVPSDFVARRGNIGVNSYRWDRDARAMVRKSTAEIEAQLAAAEQAVAERRPPG